MQGSNHGEEAEAKLHALCPVCLKKLFFSLEFDPVERYMKLRNWCLNLIETLDGKPASWENPGPYQMVFGNWAEWYQRRIEAVLEGN